MKLMKYNCVIILYALSMFTCVLISNKGECNPLQTIGFTANASLFVFKIVIYFTRELEIISPTDHLSLGVLFYYLFFPINYYACIIHIYYYTRDNILCADADDCTADAIPFVFQRYEP